MVNALRKDGWLVDPKQYFIRSGELTLVTDIRARRRDNGIRREIIVVEVKCFSKRRFYRNDLYRNDLYSGIGQYIIYRNSLRIENIEATLYLAIPVHIYRTLFKLDVIRATLSEVQIKLIIVDIEAEEIVQWID